MLLIWAGTKLLVTETMAYRDIVSRSANGAPAPGHGHGRDEGAAPRSQVRRGSLFTHAYSSGVCYIIETRAWTSQSLCCRYFGAPDRKFR